MIFTICTQFIESLTKDGDYNALYSHDHLQTITGAKTLIPPEIVVEHITLTDRYNHNLIKQKSHLGKNRLTNTKFDLYIFLGFKLYKIKKYKLVKDDQIYVENC